MTILTDKIAKNEKFYLTDQQPFEYVNIVTTELVFNLVDNSGARKSYIFAAQKVENFAMINM